MAYDAKYLKDKLDQGTKSYLGYVPGQNSEEKHPEVLKSEDLLKKFEQERERWAKKFVESNEFRNGMQWTPEQATALEERGQAPIVINRMHPMIETAKAMLTAKRPQFRATGRDDSDRKIAKIFSDLFQWVWERSSGDSELKQCIDDYYVGGLGYMYVYQDPHADMGKGEVKMRSLHPLDVYVDPNSRDPYFKDASDIIVSKIIPDSMALKLYPDYEDVILSSEENKQDRYPTGGMSDGQEQYMMEDFDRSNDDKIYREYIERYTMIKTEMYHVFDTTNKSECMLNAKELDEYLEEPYFVLNGFEDNTIVTEKEQVASLMEQYEAVDGLYHLSMDPQTQQPVPRAGDGANDPNNVPNSTIVMELNIKQKLLDDDFILANKILCDRVECLLSVGGKLLYSRVLPVADYPIVPMVNIHNRNPYPESDVRIYRPLQEYINKIRSLIIAHASTSTNTKLLIPRGSVNKKQLEMEWGRAGTAVIEFDAELGAPVVAGPVPLPNELYKNEAEAKHDLEYGFGIYEIMQGGNDGAPSTYRGTVAIDEYGQRRMKSRQDDLENMLNELARRTVPLIQQLYTTEKVIRLVEASGVERESTVNQITYDIFGNVIKKINDITTGVYDIKVVTGSTLPSNRFAQFDYYMELYKAGLIDQIELLKKTEVVDIDGVLGRAGQMQQLQNQVQGLDQKVKDLSGDLQTRDRELAHALKRIEVEKFKTKLNNATNRRDKAGELYEERLKDKLKEADKELSQNGSKQPAGSFIDQL